MLRRESRLLLLVLLVKMLVVKAAIRTLSLVCGELQFGQKLQLTHGSDNTSVHFGRTIVRFGSCGKMLKYRFLRMIVHRLRVQSQLLGSALASLCTLRAFDNSPLLLYLLIILCCFSQTSSKFYFGSSAVVVSNS